MLDGLWIFAGDDGQICRFADFRRAIVDGNNEGAPAMMERAKAPMKSRSDEVDILFT
jgi:hypothetical protein